jgi:hypothetical protein
MCAVNRILRTAVVGVREDVDVVESVIGCGVVVLWCSSGVVDLDTSTLLGWAGMVVR